MTLAQRTYAVVGCGSIGRRHLRNLGGLGASNVVVFDTDPARAGAAARDLGVRAAADLESCLDSADAVLVCTPPAHHLEVARAALARDAHVLVEKPIGHSLAGVDELIAEATRRGRVLCVGYNLRYHEGLRRFKDLLDAGTIGRPLAAKAEAGQYLPEWRPGQDYRRGYNASAGLGGGVILDSSHEIDYLRWLFGEITSVYCAAGHLSSLELETEDFAALTVRFAGGMLGEVHLDCAQRGYAFDCKVIGDEGTAIWDFRKGIRYLVGSAREWREIAIATDVNDMYVAELGGFIAAIDGGKPVAVDGAAGRRVLEISLAAKESAVLRREVSV